MVLVCCLGCVGAPAPRSDQAKSQQNADALVWLDANVAATAEVLAAAAVAESYIARIGADEPDADGAAGGGGAGNRRGPGAEGAGGDRPRPEDDAPHGGGSLLPDSPVLAAMRATLELGDAVTLDEDATHAFDSPRREDAAAGGRGAARARAAGATPPPPAPASLGSTAAAAAWPADAVDVVFAARGVLDLSFATFGAGGPSAALLAAVMARGAGAAGAAISHLRLARGMLGAPTVCAPWLTDELLQTFAYTFRNVTAVDLNSQCIGDHGVIEMLRALPLQDLNIRKCTNVSHASLAAMSGLRSLNVNSVNCSRSGDDWLGLFERNRRVAHRGITA